MENAHSLRIKTMLMNIGKMQIFAWVVTEWEALNDNWVGFRINKIDFQGTFNVSEIKGTDLYNVLFQEDSWKMTAQTVVTGEGLVELLTKIGGHENTERATGERAPIENILPLPVFMAN